MKRVLVLILFFVIATPVFALTQDAKNDDPYYIADCPKDPTFVCHVNTDIMTTKIPLSQDDTKFWPSDPTGLTALARKIWSGYVKPNGDYHISTRKFAAYGKQLQDASDIDLNPAQLQDIQTHDVSPKRFAITSRLCVTNPQTGELVGNFLTEKEIVTNEDIPGVNDLTEGARRMGSFTTGYVQSSQDYTLTFMKTKKLDALPCNANASGDVIEQSNIGYVDENLYGDDAITQFIYTITSAMVTLVAGGSDEKEDDSNYKSKFDIPAKHVASATNPWAAHNLCEYASCTEADLTPIEYLFDSQKKTLQEDGGIMNSMYRNDAYDPTFKSSRDVQHEVQSWDVGITHTIEEANIYAYGMARMEAAGTFGNCSIMSANDPMYARLGCNKNWLTASAGSASCVATPNASTISQAIGKAEATYGLPPGLLTAIYEIEALDLGIVNPADYVCDRNSNIPGHLADSSAGLTQLNDSAYESVTCGKGMEDDVKQCEQKKPGDLSRCDINDTFELAARLLLLKVGKWDNGGCKATGTISSNSEIYTAACQYGTGFVPTTHTIAYDYNMPNPLRTGGSMNYCDIVCNKMGRCGAFYPAQVAYPPNW